MVSKGFLRAYRFLAYEILFLIGFGGSVRTMNAGLACPDWPLCFGSYIPDFHIQVYFEFIHRVLAGSLGLLVGGMGVYLIRHKEVSSLVKGLCLASIIIVLAQVIVGGLTVLLLLKESVVTAHLLLATMLFACILVVYWELRESHQPTVFVGSPQFLRHFAYVLTGIVWVQILLGGLVSSHYAGLACPDFPLCHGQWVPSMTGLVGLQVMHRMGAYLCVLMIFAFWFAVRQWMPSSQPLVIKWSRRLLVGILLQVALGISNIFLVTPPLVVVLHLVTGTVLLGICLRLSYLLHRGEASVNSELFTSVPTRSFN